MEVRRNGKGTSIEQISGIERKRFKRGSFRTWTSVVSVMSPSILVYEVRLKKSLRSKR